MLVANILLLCESFSFNLFQSYRTRYEITPIIRAKPTSNAELGAVSGDWLRKVIIVGGICISLSFPQDSYAKIPSMGDYNSGMLSCIDMEPH